MTVGRPQYQNFMTNMNSSKHDRSINIEILRLESKVQFKFCDLELEFFFVLGFESWSLEFRICDLRFAICDLRFAIWNLEFGI